MSGITKRPPINGNMRTMFCNGAVEWHHLSATTHMPISKLAMIMNNLLDPSLEERRAIAKGLECTLAELEA